MDSFNLPVQVGIIGTTFLSSDEVKAASQEVLREIVKNGFQLCFQKLTNVGRSHLYRYADAFPTKKVTFSKIEGTRRRGRPPTQWLDDVEKELKRISNEWNQPMDGHRDGESKLEEDQ
ncbi:hypothetical protein TNCV_2593971 [Trichonephila clavipes]|nr:hypothetical protein TNCV_2593971 [Trichonephila clavipes]